MASATTVRPAPRGRLRRSQDARRARLLAAVVDLAHEGGYDAIQIRSVSDRAGISTDTIYRYFGSRDQLVSAAVRVWMEREFIEPAPSWFEGDTPAEKLLAFNRHVWDVWERHPNMLETFVRAAHVEGGSEDGLAARILGVHVPLVADALRDVEPAYRADMQLMTQHFTHSSMTYVVRGHQPISEVYPQLERIVRRLAQHPAMAAHRPAAWEWVDDPEH
jgi:TetR/AcrR family transcriptional regulator, cholesterol catabolism regulator